MCVVPQELPVITGLLNSTDIYPMLISIGFLCYLLFEHALKADVFVYILD